MTGRYTRTGTERLLRVNGHPTSQEEMRFNAQRNLVHGVVTAERVMAETILVLLDLLEATQDLVTYQSSRAEAKDQLCYEGAAS